MRTKRNGLVRREGRILVPDGEYEGRLIDSAPFATARGERMGFSYEIVGGEYAGAILMQSAARSESPTGKLAGLLRELLGREPSSSELRDGPGREHIGLACRLNTRQDCTQSGTPFSAVQKVTRI